MAGGGDVVVLSGLGDLDVFAKTASGGTFTHVSGWPLVELRHLDRAAKFRAFLRALSTSVDHRSVAELRLKKSSLRSAGSCRRMLDDPSH